MSRVVRGTHAPYMPYIGEEMDGRNEPRLLAVLLFDANVKKHVAYEGIVDKVTSDRVMGVAGRGRKLTYEQALAHWPSLQKKEYVD